MAVYPRVSGRLGNVIDLNTTFYRNGVPFDPYAIRKVEVYRSAVQAENLVATFNVDSPLNETYPYPLSREFAGSDVIPGVFHLYWEVPKTDILVPDIFFDVWYYLTDDPGAEVGITEDGGTVADITGGSILEDESLWLNSCKRFWLYPDGVYIDDELSTIRLGFEPLDVKFQSPEIRNLEVGITPLPLYDFDYNQIAPIIPLLTGTISIFTDNCESIIDAAPMTIGLRQGSYRSSPFVMKYRLDTSVIFKGHYKFQVTLAMPNGETRVSPKFDLQVG